MKMSFKRFLVPVLALVTAVSLSVPGFAASGENKIGKIRISVDIGEKPETGNSINSVDVKPNTSQEGKFTVESADFEDTNDDEWERGETPKIEIELSAADGYYFDTKSVTLSTIKSSWVSSTTVKTEDSRHTAKITIKLKKVGGDLETPEDMDWNGRNAIWEDVDGASYYSVKLYRDGSRVATVYCSRSGINLYPYMTREGDYTFEVKAMASSGSNDSDSEYSDESEELYIDEADVYKGAAPTTNDYRTSGGSSSGSSGSDAYGPTINNNPSPSSGGNSGNPQNGWVQDSSAWMYYYNGNRVYNSWIYDGSNWYFIADTGYMKTGWVYVDNNWFYLNPNVGGPQGSMRSGWLRLGENWYYLNTTHDGTFGKMITGYYTINGYNYYFGSDGVLYMNKTAPNGKTAGSDGVLR